MGTSHGDDWSSAVDSQSRPELAPSSTGRGRSRGGSRSRQSNRGDSPGKKGYGPKSISPSRSQSPARSSSMSPSRSTSRSPERRRQERDLVTASRDTKKKTWKDYAYDKK